MQHDPIIDLKNASDTERFEHMLCGIIRRYGIAYAASVVERYAENKSPNDMAAITGQFFGTSGGEINPQEIADYVQKVVDRNPETSRGG